LTLFTSLFDLFFFFSITRPPPISTLFPYTTLFRSLSADSGHSPSSAAEDFSRSPSPVPADSGDSPSPVPDSGRSPSPVPADSGRDRKSTRLNSSHSQISYAVFCLKKKKNNNHILLL